MTKVVDFETFSATNSNIITKFLKFSIKNVVVEDQNFDQFCCTAEKFCKFWLVDGTMEF